MEGKEEDVRLGANKFNERQPLGTSAQTKDYKEAPPAPLFEPGELHSWSFWRAGIAEFMATFLFLYITVLTVMGVVKSPSKCSTVGIQGIAWAFGGMIFALVYCTAGISGGHINPAVTFGLFLARKLSLARAVYYMVMQCLGAICGAGVIKGFEKSQYEVLGGGANVVAPGYTKGDGLGAEIVGTFVLVYTVFSATDAKRSARDSHVPILAPLPIGFAVFFSPYQSIGRESRDPEIENAMRANGYFDYLEGTIACPSSQIRDNNGNLVTNPDFLLWKLIDTQLLSCLTSSLSQTTLPYVLGLHHVCDLWESLSHRYNSLTKNHVQELKSKLYNIKKTSTMEAYVDLIKEYSQKLAAAGSQLEDDDLIFHLLRGLPPVFNGFKSAVRTRGHTLTFDEVLTMLHSEDLQLTQDSASESDVTSVLVATHGTSSSQQVNNPTEEQISFFKMNVPMLSQYDASAQNSAGQQSGVSSQQSFMPQQHLVSFSRNSGKGKGYRGGRYPREPCAICGRTNHITNFCYYKNQAPSPPFDQFSVQWRPGVYQSYPWTYPGQNGVVMPQQVQLSGNMGGFPISQSHQLTQSSLNSGPMVQNVSSANLGGYGSAMPMGMSQPQNQFVIPMSQPQNQFVTPQAHFTGAYSMPYGTPNSVGNNQVIGISNISQMGTHTGITGGINQQPVTGQSTVGNGVVQQPWYFDSGATHHITNNLQNLSIAQPAACKEGILVGNGNSLPVTHTGQDNSSNSIQGSMSQGLVSYSELL